MPEHHHSGYGRRHGPSEVACAGDGECTCFTFCPSPAVGGCPDGPSCPCPQGADRGPRRARVSPLAVRSQGPRRQISSVWTAYQNAPPSDPDTLAFYPTYPAEFARRRPAALAWSHRATAENVEQTLHAGRGGSRSEFGIIICTFPVHTVELMRVALLRLTFTAPT